MSTACNVQACLILWCSALLHFTGMFLQVKDKNPSQTKRLQLALLPYTLYCGGLEWNQQYLGGMSVDCGHRPLNTS